MGTKILKIQVQYKYLTLFFRTPP